MKLFIRKKKLKVHYRYYLYYPSSGNLAVGCSRYACVSFYGEATILGEIIFTDEDSFRQHLFWEDLTA